MAGSEPHRRQRGGRLQRGHGDERGRRWLRNRSAGWREGTEQAAERRWVSRWRLPLKFCAHNSLFKTEWESGRRLTSVHAPSAGGFAGCKAAFGAARLSWSVQTDCPKHRASGREALGPGWVRGARWCPSLPGRLLLFQSLFKILHIGKTSLRI